MNRLIKVVVLVSFLCVSQNIAQPSSDFSRKQGILLRDVPQKVDTKARYLFYISGYIVEAGNRRPTSPKFGVYEYEQILETFKQSGFVVISEAREQSPEIKPYAAKVAGQVKRLLTAGVPPQNITVVGASQGSWIAMLVSTYLENRKVNFVVIGACSADDGLLQLVDLHGNILFISERTDLPGSCQRFRADATGLGEYKEVETNTGQKHGFLYRPMKEWVEPTVAWRGAEGLNVSLIENFQRHSVGYCG
jgi:pimeloyl-ACP methyl ester carboxylesterase